MALSYLCTADLIQPHLYISECSSTVLQSQLRGGDKLLNKALQQLWHYFSFFPSCYTLILASPTTIVIAPARHQRQMVIDTLQSTFVIFVAFLCYFVAFLWHVHTVRHVTSSIPPFVISEELFAKGHQKSTSY